MSGPSRLVVVGASLAGLRAVEAARREGFTGSLTLVGAEPHLPYDRPPLSKAYLQELAPGAEPPVVHFRELDVLERELGVELVLGSPATALDTGTRTVTVGSGPGAREVGYDALVIATGSTPRRLPGTGHLAGVHSLRTLDDARAVRAGLDAGARLVVIGAGFIGAEVASTAAARGLAPVVVESRAVPMVRAVGEQMGAVLAGLHARHGVELLCGTGVAAVEGDGRVERVVLADGRVLPADMVVVGVGATPATGWLEGSGLVLDDGVVCDEHLSTGVEGVYAAGDVARWYNRSFGRLMRLEHWTSAADQGAAAARNAVHPGEAVPFSTVPYFWSDQYGVRVQLVGVAEADEVRVVEGEPCHGGRLVALYRGGDRLVGAFTLDAPGDVMKYRAQIAAATPWSQALDFAAARGAARARREQAPAGTPVAAAAR